MKLYNEFAEWWPLLSPPEEYKEEAGLYWEIITKYKTDINTALELGSGGGSNAFHLKKHCQWTLSDLSQKMLEVSKKINPECEHVCGDMRNLNLNKKFDFVFIHDAISYITNENDLSRVFHVARSHLQLNGVLLITPDLFKDTFKPETDCGGYDKDGKGLRYLEWVYDSDPNDNIAEVEYVYVFKDESGHVTTEHESMQNGLFSKKVWKTLLSETGFEVFFEPVKLKDPKYDDFVAIVALK